MTLGNMRRLGVHGGGWGLDKEGVDVARTIRIFIILLGLTSSFSALAYDPVDCFDDIARADPTINVGLATKLCSGAWSPEPVKCYRLVPDVDNEIPRFIAIDLCAGSTNAQNTVSCYRKAMGDRGLSRGLATTLCGAKKQER
jgi:hypothetical protein